jgi:hypothetical protein
MYFEAHPLTINVFAAHKTRYVSHKVICSDSVSQKTHTGLMLSFILILKPYKIRL